MSAPDRTRRRQDGQATIELVALTPLLLFVGALVAQVAIAGYCLLAAENAARAGARAGSLCADPAAAALAAPPSWLRDQVQVDAGRSGEQVRVDVRTRVPVLFTSVALPVTVHRDAAFPLTRSC